MSQTPHTPQRAPLPKPMSYLVYGLGGALLLSTLATSAYAFAMAVQIWTAKELPSEANAGFIAVTAAIFGILITGVFVFMTFRIDRGALTEAHSTAKREAEKVLEPAKTAAREAAQQAMRETRTQTLTEAKNANEEFALRITNSLRERTINVLQERNPALPADILRLTREDGQND